MSATRFAELTGVSRERLRTWERRYGFPRPERAGDGPRRYVLGDAAAVVAVRRAAEDGVPLRTAIATAGVASDRAQVTHAGFSAIAENLPAPLLLLSGPAPVRVAYANPALAANAGGPREGDALADAAPWFVGSDCERGVEALFTTGERSLECAHPAWFGDDEQVHSLLYRLPSEPRQAPLVAVVQLDRRRELEATRALAESEAVREDLDARLVRHERWFGTIAELAMLFQRQTGASLLQATAETLVRRLPTIDAGVAVYMGGELALGSSSRGMLGPRMVPVTAHPDLAAIMRDGAPAWLQTASAAAFGAPDGLRVLVVPVEVLAETLGALLLVTEHPSELRADQLRLFSVLSASIAFALLRDRLVEAAQTGSPVPR